MIRSNNQVFVHVRNGKNMKKLFFSLLIISGISLAQNDAYLIQKSSYSEAYIEQSYGNNVLEGPNLIGQNQLVDQNGQIHNAAVQSTITGLNSLTSIQENAIVQNKIVLFQWAGMDNISEFEQYNGSQQLSIHEVALEGSNESHIKQENGENKIVLVRYAMYDNNIPGSNDTKMSNPLNLPGVYQNGNNNYISGAYSTSNPAQPAMYSENLPAIQNSVLGSNWLEVHQIGDNNFIGLTQTSLKDNEALMSQENENNTIAIVQNSVLGSNFISVEQHGNSSLSVVQNSFFENNSVIVVQH